MNIQLNKQYCTLVAIEAQVGHLRDFHIRIRKKKRLSKTKSILSKNKFDICKRNAIQAVKFPQEDKKYHLNHQKIYLKKFQLQFKKRTRGL